MNRQTIAQLIETKSLAEMAAQKLFTFVASTAAVDRTGETIDQTGWQLEDYKRNPVILDSHKYGSIDDVLGRAVRTEVGPNGLEIDVEFAETERGQMARRMVQDGFLRTVSVGFRSLQRAGGNQGQPLTHVKSELLEVSMVAIPANREAVRIRGGDLVEATKAGRRLAKSTEDKLRAAVSLLMEILDNGMGDDNGNDDEMIESGMKPKPKKSLNVEPGTLAALGRFAQGGENHG